MSASVVQVNGSNRTTTFINSTQLTAAIPSSDIASAGSLSITVVNPGGASSPLTLAVNNPVPSLTSLSPGSTTVGGPAFTLTVGGANFVSGSVIQVNGSNRTTTFVSSTQLNAAIPASDIASAGTLSISVVSPAPGGGASPALTFTVNNPVPSVSSISPNPVVSVASGYTLTINGSGFVTASVVKIDGATYPTTFVSSTQVKAQVANSGLLSLGGHSVTVFNPTPGGGTSNAVTVTVVSLL
jgi:hypothetical protein